MFRRKHWNVDNLYSSSRKEVTRIDKNGEEIKRNVFYKLQFTNSERFVARLLWSLVNNSLKKYMKSIVNADAIIENAKLAELDIHIAIVFLNTQTLKMI